MNKTDIEWTDFSWNPVTGCLHGCKYCYARALYKWRGFDWKPAFHENRLNEPSKERFVKIFVCSVADLFGEWVPREWIDRVFNVVNNNPDNIFQFLTKNPKRLIEFSPYPDNCWIGCSATDQRMTNNSLYFLEGIKAKIRYISFEPLLDSINIEFNKRLDWVIIGPQTGAGANQPNPEWVHHLIYSSNKDGIPIFMKPKLVWHNPSRDFPEFSFPGSLFR